MTVQELIEQLQELAGINPGMEVRLAIQPNYPLEYTLEGITTNTVIEDGGEEVCYLLQGTQLGYTTRHLWGN